MSSLHQSILTGNFWASVTLNLMTDTVTKKYHVRHKGFTKVLFIVAQAYYQFNLDIVSALNKLHAQCAYTFSVIAVFGAVINLITICDWLTALNYSHHNSETGPKKVNGFCSVPNS